MALPIFMQKGEGFSMCREKEGNQKPYTVLSTLDMDYTEWLKIRKTGIGGSDAGAVCGLNPYRSPMAVYQDKVSEEIEYEDNESMRQGRDLEEYVARRFTEETGLKVRRSNKMYRSSIYPFMLADVDRLIVGEDAGLECKTASAYSADQWKDGAIPAHYLIQCYHYMAVSGKRTWYIAVLIMGKEFQHRKIVWDDDLIRDLTTIEEKFWNDHVVPRIMPDPDGSRACDEVLNQYFGRSRCGTEIPLVGFDEKLKRREELIQLSRHLEEEQKRIEQEIKMALGANERGFSSNYRVSWTSVDTARLDTKKIKEEVPDLYKKYLKVSTTRRFEVKAA